MQPDQARHGGQPQDAERQQGPAQPQEILPALQDAKHHRHEQRKHARANR